MADAAVASDDVADFSLGKKLHHGVPAERWCVTRRDLRHLRALVCEALQEGRLVPTARDAFDPKDRRYGPTIYTITDQLVKPITAQAGGMSWALMRHPEGLKCDLFITHAWQEGIFEFIDKVLASWPRGLKHAWCCMLGLPQNLDISELIATPSSSPFAHALAFAPCMLVVPNHTGSIYTRLWCVYEAFLAYQWDKVVITARNRCSRKEWRVFPPVVLCLVLGAALSSFGRLSESCLAATVSLFASYFIILCSMLIRKPIVWRCINLFGCIVAGGYFWSLQHMPAHASEARCFSGYQGYDDWRQWQLHYSIAMAAFLALSELDRVAYMESKLEAAELTAGYTGSVSDASCSSAEDAAKIRAEVDCCSEDVDRTVQVLVSAGMSTASLREAAERGVDLEMFYTSSSSFGAFIIGRPGITSSPVTEFWKELTFLSVMNLVFGLIWIAIQVYGRRDVQTWSYLVAQKTTVVLVWPVLLVLLACWVREAVSTSTMLLVVELWGGVGWLLVVTLSLAHVNRVARLPFVGRRLAQFCASRSPSALRKVWAPAPAPSGGTASSASSSGFGGFGVRAENSQGAPHAMAAP